MIGRIVPSNKYMAYDDDEKEDKAQLKFLTAIVVSGMLSSTFANYSNKEEAVTEAIAYAKLINYKVENPPTPEPTAHDLGLADDVKFISCSDCHKPFKPKSALQRICDNCVPF